MRTEDAECNLMEDIFYFATIVLVIKVVRVSTTAPQKSDQDIGY